MRTRSSVYAANPPPDVLFSRDGLYRAWQIMRRNGHAAGVDHVSAGLFERNLRHELGKLRAELIDGSYRPHAVQRYYKLKPSGKKRALSIWTIRDRVAQRVILEYLTPILEGHYLDCSYGFRPGRRIDHAVAAVMRGYQQGRNWVVDADIADCFDSIPIEPLMARVEAIIPSARAVALIRCWLNTPIMGQPGIVAGVSQGAVISPQLTNLYLHRFDVALTTLLPTVSLVRFADDFVILCKGRLVAQAALVLARQTLAQSGLRLNPQKTRIIPFEAGFTFLGVAFHEGGHGPLPGTLALIDSEEG